jgi:integrase
MTTLPVRRFTKVWIKKRKNPPRPSEKKRTHSYTLQWTEFGRDRYYSLGPGATLAFAREAAREKEQELNSFGGQSPLEPLGWDAFRKKYLDTTYPGHELAPAQRKLKSKEWPKGTKSFLRERLAMDNFARLGKPGWCHEITSEDRERFAAARLAEVGSAETVDTELRVVRHLCNVMEEWKHRPENSNPFAGRGRATVGAKRKRAKEQAAPGRKEKHYAFEEVRAILALAAEEAAREKELKARFTKRRLSALVHFVAYTGCRLNEATHLEWKDVDFGAGIAWLYFKVEHDLKTEGSEAPFGLPDRLVEVLKDWRKDETCSWVFPNASRGPWKTGGPGFRPLDQLRALGARGGVKGADFRRFRHTLSTLGKGRFGMTREQVRAQLRHTLESTQDNYSHDDLDSLRAAVKGVDFGG